MIDCLHSIEVAAGELPCTLEHGHGQPHQAMIANDAGRDYETHRQGDDWEIPPRRYRARVILVWQETREPVDAYREPVDA